MASAGRSAARSKTCLHVIGETPAVQREEAACHYGDGYFQRASSNAWKANFESVANVVRVRMRFGTWRARKRGYVILRAFKSIDDIGNRMADFLKRPSRFRRNAIPFLARLGRVGDGRPHQSFFADDVPPLDLVLSRQGVARANRGAERASRWTRRALLFLYVALAGGSNSGASGREMDNAVNGSRACAEPGKFRVLVYRQSDKLIRCAPLETAPFSLLERLQRGQPLGRALSSLRARKATPVQEWFQEWVRVGRGEKRQVRLKRSLVLSS